MSFHKHDHHHHDHHHHQPKPCREEEEYWCEGERIYAAPPPCSAYGRSECAQERLEGGRYERERWHGHNSNNGTNFQRNERLGELGAAVAGAFALYEEHKAKIDPEHASKHHLEAGTAGLGALGSAGYAYHEHREKKKFEDGYW